MKILIICNFSAGISGVWNRAFQDAREFVKQGHEVHVFSSNITGNGERVETEEIIEGIKIRRFLAKKREGYAIWFSFEEEAFRLSPDVIICHGYRKPFLVPSINVANRIGAKVCLITHAPFEVKRSFKLSLCVKLYDFFYKGILNKFDKVIAITKWEIPYLLKLGCKKEKIVLISNGIPQEFFQ